MSRKLLLPFLVGAAICAFVLLSFRLADRVSGGSGDGEGSGSVSKIEEVIRLVNTNYFEVADNKKMVEDAIRGMLDGLDPHTFYIPASELQGINEEMQGSFEGIGIEFNILEDTILVVSPISGGPSEKLGIMPGDRIVKIEAETVAGIGITNNDVVKRLRGKKGTTVKVFIRRTGFKDLLEFDIVRDKIPLHSVDYSYLVDKEIGYITVNRFSGTTIQEFMEHIEKLKKQGMKNLILDLRGNPGGYLEMAQLMADIFLPEGKMMVYTEGRVAGTNKKWHSTSRIDGFEKGGLVILINQGSASASEIVSGAVQDWDRGLVVGSRSFGKGLVQQQYPLSDGSAIRVVVSRYFTPSGRCIQKPYSKGKKAKEEYEDEVYERYQSGEMYDSAKAKIPDSLKYKTASGRTVYGGGGIMPDVFVPTDTAGASPYLTALITKNLFRKYSFVFPSRHPEVKAKYPKGSDFAKTYQIDDAMLKEFTAYAAEQGVPFVEKDYQTSKKYIARNLKVLVARYLYNDEGYYPSLHQDDPVFLKAVQLMPKAVELSRSGKYND